MDKMALLSFYLNILSIYPSLCLPYLPSPSPLSTSTTCHTPCLFFPLSIPLLFLRPPHLSLLPSNNSPTPPLPLFLSHYKSIPLPSSLLHPYLSPLTCLPFPPSCLSLYLLVFLHLPISYIIHPSIVHLHLPASPSLFLRPPPPASPPLKSRAPNNKLEQGGEQGRLVFQIVLSF